MLEKDNYGHFWFVRDKTLYRELGLNRDELFEGGIRGTIYQKDGQLVVSNAVLQLMIEDNLIAMGESDSTGMFQLTLLSNFPIENYNFNVNTDSLTYKYQNKRYEKCKTVKKFSNIHQGFGRICRTQKGVIKSCRLDIGITSRNIKSDGTAAG